MSASRPLLSLLHLPQVTMITPLVLLSLASTQVYGTFVTPSGFNAAASASMASAAAAASQSAINAPINAAKTAGVQTYYSCASASLSASVSRVKLIGPADPHGSLPRRELLPFRLRRARTSSRSTAPSTAPTTALPRTIKPPSTRSVSTGPATPCRSVTRSAASSPTCKPIQMFSSDRESACGARSSLADPEQIALRIGLVSERAAPPGPDLHDCQLLLPSQICLRQQHRTRRQGLSRPQQLHVQLD